MGRKKKLVNNTTIPQYAIERFARCVFDDIRADYAKPEVQADFQRWLAEREANKKTRVAKTAALVSVMWFWGNKQIIRTRFRFGRYGSDYIALVHRKGLEPLNKSAKSVGITRVLLFRCQFHCHFASKSPIFASFYLDYFMMTVYNFAYKIILC